MASIRSVFYFMCTCIYIWTYLVHEDVMNRLIADKVAPANQKTKSKRYLTYWCMIIQLGYNLIALLVSILNKRRYQRYISWFWQSIAFPIGLMVVFLFWSLYFINPNFVGDPRKSPYFDGIPQHLLHTAPLVTQLFEACYVKHSRINDRYTLLGGLSLACTYVSYTIYCKVTYGTFAYPVLNMLWEQPIYFVVFILACTFLSYILSRIAVKLNR